MRTFSLTLVLTHACDLACTYCNAGPKDSRKLPETLGVRAIERALAGLGAGDTLSLGFYGGEPLLEWELAKRLLDVASKKCAEKSVELSPHLTTNGTRVDERVARELVALEVETAVSIDGLPEVHDADRVSLSGEASSARALAALERLQRAGAKPRVVSVVRPSNVARLVEGMRFLADRGARSLEPSLDHTARWTLEDARRLEQAVSGLGELWAERFPELSISWIENKVAVLAGMLEKPVACGFGSGEVAVAPSGRIYPCERLVADDRPGPFARGHILDSVGAFTTLGLSCAPGDESCGGCATRFACASSCACANLARTGSPDVPDGLVCALEHASLAAARAALIALERRVAA